MRHGAATIGVVILIATALAGCASVQTPLAKFDQSSAPQSLRVGVTTQEQVKALLGQPTKQTTNASGKTEWLFAQITTMPVLGFGGKARIISVEFDANGVVSNYSVIDKDYAAGTPLV